MADAFQLCRSRRLRLRGRSTQRVLRNCVHSATSCKRNARSYAISEKHCPNLLSLPNQASEQTPRTEWPQVSQDTRIDKYCFTWKTLSEIVPDLILKNNNPSNIKYCFLTGPQKRQLALEKARSDASSRIQQARRQLVFTAESLWVILFCYIQKLISSRKVTRS